VKSLLDQLQHICDELRDKNEIAIIKEYGRNAKRYTIILLCKTLYVEKYYNTTGYMNYHYHIKGI